MRFRSDLTRGFQVYAVTGTNTVSFAVHAQDVARQGLLGFAIERHDPAENERYFLYGFKVFEALVPHPSPTQSVSTFDHPVQSFVYDDFTAKPGRRYDYWFHPLKGTPKNIDRSARPVQVAVDTEPLFSTATHDVFFNRGVASSQAYARRFDNQAPAALAEPRRSQALQWLSRELDDAMLRFIAQAQAGDTLLGCFYEFRYRPVAQALKQAADRGVKVQLILDAKVNESLDKKTGKMTPSFPRLANLAMVSELGFADDAVILRQAKRNDIQHNKFMVWLQGSAEQPAAVWTGSTNISEGGIFGQTNVGHWVRDRAVAASFQAYWHLLATDPGGAAGDSRAETLQKNKALKASVDALSPSPRTLDDVPTGVTTVFSPRPDGAMLGWYADVLDSADKLTCITLAFGISDVFKQQMQDNTASDHLAFFLLEKRDKPNPSSKTPFITLDARHNVYKAWGSFLRQPLHQWVRETWPKQLGLNQHVSFIHSKFLLRDPLGSDPVVVTGSANFSVASTMSNDENMLLIRGDQRVADIYFTEFNRLFFHYYFRSVVETLQQRNAGQGVAPQNTPTGEGASMFLAETDAWLKKYAPGSLRQKRVDLFVQMKGITP